MEREIYLKTLVNEEHHWWFIGRRTIVGKVLYSLSLPHDAKILEMGCGSGGNLALLSRYGKVYASEPDLEAISYAEKRLIAPVLPGSLPGDIPFSGLQFDLIIMIDVLEHVDEDQASLKNLYNYLKVGGYLLLTVPSFQGLWNKHDDLHHHKRRYTRNKLSNIVRNNSYEIIIISYFNTILFPVIAGMRLIQQILNLQVVDDLKPPPQPLNSILAKVFAF